jgi:hypothetical protein
MRLTIEYLPDPPPHRRAKGGQPDQNKEGAQGGGDGVEDPDKIILVQI